MLINIFTFEVVRLSTDSRRRDEKGGVMKQTTQDNWQPMSSAPKNAKEIEVKMRDGQVLTAHWAQDLSGEDQPPFIGWFTAAKDSRGKTSRFREIETPIAWRPVSGAAA